MPDRLLVFQALWGMQGLGSGPAELGEQFDRVKSAGFDGMTVDLGALSMAHAEQTLPHFRRTGLAAGLTAFPRDDDSLRAALDLAHRMGTSFVTVVGQLMPLKLAQMVAVIERWLAIAADAGMPIHFETHRNCITNDLYNTALLIEAVPKMRLAADLSHYVVDREMPCPPDAQLQALIAAVIARADSFQGRVATRGQIQVPLHFAQNAKWVQLFRDWWLAGFRHWRQRPRPAPADLIFLCELGPPDYALTDANGREMSDRWAEAQLLAQWAREAWAQSATGFTRT